MSDTERDTVNPDIGDSADHWLVRPANIRRLWIGGFMLLAITVLAQLMIPVKGYFGFDGLFGFGAIFGFFSCVAMVLVANLLGFILKRDEGYYAGRGDQDDD